MLAVDLRQLGWEQTAWAEILQVYPYGWIADKALTAKLEELTGTPLPVVRADWFAHAGSRPPLYHQILKLPENGGVLEKRLGIDFQKNFAENKLVRAGYLGASTTTSGYRVVERQEIKTYAGGYWRSYDFGQGMSPGGKGNPLLHPLGPFQEKHPFEEKAFIRQGSEILFNLPNGLQGYLVTDAEDKRLNEPPTSLLKDKNEFSGSPALVNGISCIACHAQGINNVVDQVRDEAIGKRFAGRLLDWTEAFYPPKSVMDDFLKRDRKRFTKAIEEATDSFTFQGKNVVPLPKTEMIHALAFWYRQKVGLEEAARELGYAETDAFKKDLLDRHEAVKGLGFKVSLLQEGGRVNNCFSDWPDFNRMIGLGWRIAKFGDRLYFDEAGKAVRVPKGEGDNTGETNHPYAIVLRDTEHAISKGMPEEWMHAKDQLMHNLRGPAEEVRVLATAFCPKTKVHEPIIWAVNFGKGRIVQTPMGHDLFAMRCVGFITTMERSTEWAAIGKVTFRIPVSFPGPAKASQIDEKKK
ncbi:MAG: hypothetical protein EXR98_21620 [Gemmataceae bacterium]|nr:hypothetical protein [Gemmataceae bacterium]